MMNIIKFAGEVTDPYFQVICLLVKDIPHKYVFYTSIDTNIVGWAEENTDRSKSNVEAQLKLLHLNKDNDILFDINDKFPVVYDDYYDSDFDGIGDEYIYIIIIISFTSSYSFSTFSSSFSFCLIIFVFIYIYRADLIDLSGASCAKNHNCLSDSTILWIVSGLLFLIILITVLVMVYLYFYVYI